MLMRPVLVLTMGETGVLAEAEVQSAQVWSVTVVLEPDGDTGDTGVLAEAEVQSAQVWSVTVVLEPVGETGDTGVLAELAAVVQSAQVWSVPVEVVLELLGDTGETGVLAELAGVVQSAHEWYGQSVTVGSQEVMVTSTVSVRTALAEATATRPAATATEERIFEFGL